MKGQHNFSIPVTNHGFDNNKALVDGCIVARALVGGGGPMAITDGGCFGFYFIYFKKLKYKKVEN